MDLSDLITDVLTHAEVHANERGVSLTPVPGLFTVCGYQPTEFQANVYDPVVCLILQGRKETSLDDSLISVGAGETLIVSHHVPVMSRIIEASRSKPYVALIQTLDLDIIRSLIDKTESGQSANLQTRSMNSGEADEKLVECMRRAFSLTSDPQDIPVMAPLLQSEIHFRLLRAKHGGMLRELLKVDSSASRISNAVELIRARFRESISVSVLARSVGMSSSSFHEHFKIVTGKSPLQYQKELRLLEAKRLLLESSEPVSRVAFEVGYESPNQFSREFSRKFGTPPARIGAQDQLA